MIVARTPEELWEVLDPERGAGRTIGFVPTMGALHDGHLSLVRRARDENEVVVMSIFVNPLQFGPGEDLERYPRDEATDLDLAEQEKVDIVFLPSPATMYPERSTTTVSVGALGDTIEGELRPGHFDGVATVVTKLFNLVAPHRAYFGQKDAQQVAVIESLVRDFDLRIDIVVGETVRDADGLALSSRNAYLSSSERRDAGALFRALTRGREVLLAGGSTQEAEQEMWQVMDAREGVEPAYAKVVDLGTFRPANGLPALLLVSATVGPARLIDNLVVNDPSEQIPASSKEL